jgi:hypothetical protein
MSNIIQINHELILDDSEWISVTTLEPDVLYTGVKHGYRVYPIEEPINMTYKNSTYTVQILCLTLELGKTFIYFKL